MGRWQMKRRNEGIMEQYVAPNRIVWGRRLGVLLLLPLMLTGCLRNSSELQREHIDGGLTSLSVIGWALLGLAVYVFILVSSGDFFRM